MKHHMGHEHHSDTILLFFGHKFFGSSLLQIAVVFCNGSCVDSTNLALSMSVLGLLVLGGAFGAFLNLIATTERSLCGAF